MGFILNIMNYILVSEKSWHLDLFRNLQKGVQGSWTLITSKDQFTAERLKELSPKYIFIPHWSYIISSEVYDNFMCIVFHMTDLPFGRGGSPLQNLIVRGHKQTIISAIKVEKGIDTGPVFMKLPLSLLGTAEEIFIRMASIIEGMIQQIIIQQLEPKKQIGVPVIFERRKLEDGNITNCETIEQLYDMIRMLDCEGYPKAFYENDKFRFEFTRASIKSGKKIKADVRIIEK